MVLVWANRYAPLYSDVKHKRKLCDVLQGTLLKRTGITDGFYEQVIYASSTAVATGWIHMDDIEDYVRNYATNVVPIENQTPQVNDFEQYIIYKSKKQVNMCGELCVANVLNVSLGTILTNWEVKLPVWYKRFFGGDTIAPGTGPDDLVKIFSIFDRRAELLKESLYQSHVGRARYTIKGLNNLLSKGSVIMSIHIDKYTGLIKPSGVLHWIGLKTILAERNGQGFVTFYNPAMNCIESASWNELMQSSGTAPYGVFVPQLENIIPSSGTLWMENRD